MVKDFGHLSSTSGSTLNFMLFSQLYLKVKYKEKKVTCIISWLAGLSYHMVTQNSQWCDPGLFLLH